MTTYNYAGEGENPETNPSEETSYRMLRRRGKAKPPRKENVPQGMVQCSICNALVPNSRLLEHTEKYHGEEEQDEMHLEKCPFCGVEVRQNRLEKHIRKSHPGAKLPEK